MMDLIERLRAVEWEEADDCDRMPDDPTHKCVFVDMRPDDFEALLNEAAAALEAAQQRIACLPADWREDSSLETWFPFTAEQLAALQAENERLRAEVETWKTYARGKDDLWQESVRRAERLAEALRHQRWCRTCAEDGWESCEEGRKNDALLRDQEEGK